MSEGEKKGQPFIPFRWETLARKNVLAGLLFIGVAVIGLWVSRHYPIGTALRMGTGYVPRLLLWILLVLGGVVLLQGLREARAHSETDGERTSILRPIVFVTLSLVAFALAIERLGLVISIVLLIGIGSLASRESKPLETLLTAAVLLAFSVAIFIVGLGLTMPVWPEW